MLLAVLACLLVGRLPGYHFADPRGCSEPTPTLPGQANAGLGQPVLGATAPRSRGQSTWYNCLHGFAGQEQEAADSRPEEATER